MHYYRLSVQDTLADLGTTRDGLTNDEAAKRLEMYGANQLEIKARESALVTYLKQFKDLMIVLLLASAGIALWLGDSRTAIVLAILVLFNTIIGFVQEYKAEKVMESLEKLVIHEAVVLRGGAKTAVPTSELVVGDVVYLEEGNAVPADLRLIEEDELSTNDFALTGESDPSRKFTHAIEGDVLLPNKHNLVFMDTTVATGLGYGVVIGTGMKTELGRIASMSQSLKKQTSPLQKEINNIATRVTQGTILLCVILLPLATTGGLGLKEAFLFAIGIASSIIPQGLPAEISTSLAQAAGKLAKAKALVKKLSSVETLGATNIICTDKTGTLTKNQMTVEEFMIGTTSYTVTGKGYEPNGLLLTHTNEPLTSDDHKKFELLFVAGALASNAQVNPPDAEHEEWYCVGDPTEGAIVTFAEKAGIDHQSLNQSHPELKEFTFDSNRKRMSSIRRYGTKERLHLFAKGSPESILEQCTSIWINGKERALTDKDRRDILAKSDALAADAMRNLGIAYRILPSNTDPKKITMQRAESKLVWLGLVSMIDPLREQVPNAMDAARSAHIKIAIITGDHAITAKAIAARAHLAADPNDITTIQGDELQKLSDIQVLNAAQKGNVIFSRVTPEDKLRIVQLLEDNQLVVAVTGDGINDAPALKHANIGVAMGVTGTDVAKQSAEVVLLDDSFTTLVGAVQEGRVIFQNIRKGALSAFTSNAAELVVNLLSLMAATLFQIPLAITVMQILAIDLVAELFPIAALGKDKGDGELMSDPPRRLKDHILNKQSILDLAWCGLLIGGFAFLNYLWFFERNGVSGVGIDENSALHMQATALTYLTIVLCQLANIMYRRTSAGIFSKYQLHNRQFWLAIGFSLLCVSIIIYQPNIGKYFNTMPLSFVDWLYALGAMGVFVAIREFQRHNRQHHRRSILNLHEEVLKAQNQA